MSMLHSHRRGGGSHADNYFKVYQLGRAVTAVTLQQDTVDVARQHALQLIAIEQRLHIFWEPGIRAFFLGYPTLMKYINRLYSFIHIPGMIFFLVYLYWFCVTVTSSPTSLRSMSVRSHPARRARSPTRLVAGRWSCATSSRSSSSRCGRACRRVCSATHLCLGNWATFRAALVFWTLCMAGGTSSVWMQNKFYSQHGQWFIAVYVVCVYSLTTSCSC